MQKTERAAYRKYVMERGEITSPEAMRRCGIGHNYPFYRQTSLSDFYIDLASRFVRRFLSRPGVYRAGRTIAAHGFMRGDAVGVIATIAARRDARRGLIYLHHRTERAIAPCKADDDEMTLVTCDGRILAFIRGDLDPQIAETVDHIEREMRETEWPRLEQMSKL